MYIFPVTCEMKELIVMLGSHCASKLEPTLSGGGPNGSNVLGICFTALKIFLQPEIGWALSKIETVAFEVSMRISYQIH